MLSDLLQEASIFSKPIAYHSTTFSLMDILLLVWDTDLYWIILSLVQQMFKLV